MSLRDRLRPSASLTAPDFAHRESQATKERTKPFNRILLSCDDTDSNGSIQREFVFIRGVHRAIDFVRGNSAAAGPAAGLVLQRGDCARAALTSPVMSRRHARLTLVDDGSVVIADVGSMHGTFMAGPNLIGALPDKLKPRRNYTLRDGDVLVFGKPIIRDARDWKPVTIRVTLGYDDNDDNATLSQAPHLPLSSSSQASEPAELHSPYHSLSLAKEADRHSPNRFGMFINSAGSSVLDDDDIDDDESSSSSTSDADSHALSMSSPDSSPLFIPHSPKPLKVLNNLAKRSSASIAASSASISKSILKDEIESWGTTPGVDSGFILPIRPASAGSEEIRAIDSYAKRASRSLWPVKLASITRLPSLRDLGLFGGSSNVANPEPVAQNPGSSEKDPLFIDDNDNEKGDDVSGNVTFALSSPAKSTSVPASASASSNELDSLSQSRWAEPSFPQNQLGLRMSFGSGLSQSHSLVGDSHTEAEDARRMLSDPVSTWEFNHTSTTPLSVSQSASQTPQSAAGYNEQTSEQGDEDASAMEISPLTSRSGSPISRAVSIPDVAVIPRGSEPSDKACDQKERIVVNLVSDDEEQEVSKRVTPKKISLRLPRRPHYSQVYHRLHRSKSRSRHDASQSQSQSQAHRLSSREKRVAMVQVSETAATGIDAKEEKQGEAIEMAVKELSELVKGFVERSGGGQWAGVEEKAEGAAKEVKEMREDMRRLSDLVTTLAEKVSAQHLVSSLGDATVEGSRKRKRTPDSDVDSSTQSASSEVDSGLNMRVEQLESELSRLQSSRILITNPRQSLTPERSTRVDAHPSTAKRARTDGDSDDGRRRKDGSGVGRSIASAAGYTTLGAALAWAALAYAL